MSHDRLERLGPQAFRRQVLDARHLLEDQAAAPVVGFRAPSFSLGQATAWAVDVLCEAGFEYDASIYPVRHPWYGVRSAPAGPFRVRAAAGRPSLLEVPPLTWSLPRCRGRMAVGGGGHFRLLPLWFVSRGLAEAMAEDRPAVLYFHPWEFDPGMPGLPLRLDRRLRTYVGVRSAAGKLERLLKSPARFSTIESELAACRRHADQRPVFNLESASQWTGTRRAA